MAYEPIIDRIVQTKADGTVVRFIKGFINSDDPKPVTGIYDRSELYERDTGKWYLFNMSMGEWFVPDDNTGGGSGGGSGDVAADKVIASAYSTSGAYAAGSYVTKGGKLYKAKQMVSNEPWTAAHWEETKIMNEVSSIEPGTVLPDPSTGTNGMVVSVNNGEYVLADAPQGGGDSELPDPSQATEGNVLTVHNGEWIASAPQGGSGEPELPDASQATEGNVLTVYNNEWVAAAPQVGEPELPDASEASEGDILIVHDGEWVAGAFQGGGGEETTEDITPTDITAGGVRHGNGVVADTSTYNHTDFMSLEGIATFYYTRITTTNGTANYGIAFYSDANEESFISGVSAKTSQARVGYEDELIAVPNGANYVRFSVLANNVAGFRVWIITETSATPTIVINELPEYSCDIALGTLTNGGIQYVDGVAASSSSYRYTNFIDIMKFSSIEYSRITNTTSTPTYGIAFYSDNNEASFISGISNLGGQASAGYATHKVPKPDGACYMRLSVLSSNASGAYAKGDVTVETVANEVFKFGQNTILTKKKVSILGDSISTFATDVVTSGSDSFAADTCTTNYPGNRIRYPYDNVNTVSKTWWGRILDHFGWELGINESWAGSTITWNGGATTTTRGENVCMASDARISHLGENGTPDIIFVYGGTNDINHNTEENIAIGELSQQNIETFENLTFAYNTFYSAVFAMFIKIQHLYPSAKIICILPYYCTFRTSYTTTPIDVKIHNDALIDVCDYLGIEYIDLRKIVNVYDTNLLAGGSDILHPNATGMKMIADMIIKKIYTMSLN